MPFSAITGMTVAGEVRGPGRHPQGKPRADVWASCFQALPIIAQSVVQSPNWGQNHSRNICFHSLLCTGTVPSPFPSGFCTLA